MQKTNMSSPFNSSSLQLTTNNEEILNILEFERLNSEIDDSTFPKEIATINIFELIDRLKIEEISIVNNHERNNNEENYSVIFRASNDDTSKITRCIQEDQILKTRLTLEKKDTNTKKSSTILLDSFWDVWKSNESFRNEIINSKDPNEEKWKLTRKYNYKIATTFMPIYAKSIYQYFGCPKIVLDPCSGWGDRLLGAETSGIEKYIGFDPNIDLRYGYSRIMSLLEHSVTELSRNYMKFSNSYEIHSEPFEIGCQNISSNSIDFIFTSPPFFEYEVYTVNNPVYTDWITEFYEPLFIQCDRVLKPECYACIYIADTSSGKINKFITERVEQICNLKLEKKCIGFQGIFSGTIRKMWVFKKSFN